MNDQLVNRLAMFQNTLRTLNEYREIWDGQSPPIFGHKVAEVTELVAKLESITRHQTAATTGSTEEKRDAEEALEESAYVFGNNLAIFLAEQGDKTGAAKIGLSQTAWRRLRDQLKLEKARLVVELGQTVVAGESSEQAAVYGITSETLAEFTVDVEAYAGLVTATEQAITGRKALTAELPERFNETTEKFETLDRLIMNFRRTETGRAMISAYQAARIIRDRGRGKSSPATPESSEAELANAVD